MIAEHTLASWTYIALMLLILITFLLIVKFLDLQDKVHELEVNLHDQDIVLKSIILKTFDD